jgi:hypothetical protein
MKFLVTTISPPAIGAIIRVDSAQLAPGRVEHSLIGGDYG